MTATINQCLDQLATTLAAALVPAKADKVYDYRTVPVLLPKSVSLTYMGGLPVPLVTGDGGQAAHYDFAAVLLAQHDNTAAQLEAAERALNDMEQAIFDTLFPSRNSYWMKIEFYQPSRRPPSPVDGAKWRYGEVYWRLLLK